MRRAFEIRPASVEDAADIARVIGSAFRPVAARFGIDSSNAPTHPSNVTPDWIVRDLQSGYRYFVAALEGEVIGCVAWRASNGVIEAQRLAVLPNLQLREVSTRLITAVRDAARGEGCAVIRIAIVAAHESLRRWYVRMGFVERETVTFDHLPFDVMYLEYTMPRRDTERESAGE